MFVKSINWPITISIFLLLSVSILVISTFSVSQAIQQAAAAIIGIALFLFISQLNYRILNNLIKPAYIFAIVLLIIVALLGIETRGSVRWIPLGIFNIQPSEFAKPIIILVLSYFWTKNNPSWRNILKSTVLIAPLIILVFKQPDLGTTATILSIWFGILISTRVAVKKILILILVGILIFPINWLTFQDYQRQRLLSFLYPGSDPLGRGYNLIQSTIAVGSGQFLGRGLGFGTQSRLQFLPEFRTDFIFAAIAEELGFLGAILILTIYFYIVSYCFKVAIGASDYLGFLIAFGVAIMFLFQTAVNIGMNIGVVPITGITLPLISYGGSSLLANLISLGLVASVARSPKKIDITSLGS